jgi:hypothetical protein
MEQNREPRNIEPHKYNQLIFDKGARAAHMHQYVFSTNSKNVKLPDEIT